MLNFIIKFVAKLMFKIKIYNKENLEQTTQPYIICANHISFWDSIILYLFLDKDIYFIGKQELFNNPILKKILTNRNVIPINREKPSLSTMKQCLNVLTSSKILGIFPQGTRKVPLSSENIKNGICFFAYSTNSPVFPIFIDADYKFRSNVNIFIGDPIYPEDKGNKKENFNYLSNEIYNSLINLKNKKEKQ